MGTTKQKMLCSTHTHLLLELPFGIKIKKQQLLLKITNITTVALNENSSSWWSKGGDRPVDRRDENV